MRPKILGSIYLTNGANLSRWLWMARLCYGADVPRKVDRVLIQARAQALVARLRMSPQPASYLRHWPHSESASNPNQASSSYPSAGSVHLAERYSRPNTHGSTARPEGIALLPRS